MGKEVTLSTSADTVMTGGGKKTKKKRKNAATSLHIYTLAQAQNTLLICREAPVCLQSAGNDGDGVQEEKKKKLQKNLQPAAGERSL